MKRKQLLLLLVLLMTAATGAWAQQTLTVYDGTDRENTSPAGFAYCDDYVRIQTIIPSTATSTDEEGNETTTTTGYYVVRFENCNDNNFPLKNVRHILAKFEGGTTDSATGTRSGSGK